MDNYVLSDGRAGGPFGVVFDDGVGGPLSVVSGGIVGGWVTKSGVELAVELLELLISCAVLSWIVCVDYQLLCSSKVRRVGGHNQLYIAG